MLVRAPSPPATMKRRSAIRRLRVVGRARAKGPSQSRSTQQDMHRGEGRGGVDRLFGG